MLYLNLSAVEFGAGESGFEVEQLGSQRTWSHAVNERRLTLNADPKADCRHCPTFRSFFGSNPSATLYLSLYRTDWLHSLQLFNPRHDRLEHIVAVEIASF